MPLRPDLPTGLNLSRRTTTPVKLPRMNFTMIGGALSAEPGGLPEPSAIPFPETVETRLPMQEASTAMPDIQSIVTSRENSRVIVYGQSGCTACMAAIQDLVARQVSFTYCDVTRDSSAMAHLQAICGNEPAVPVIITIGFGGV
jgi:glutaredoxin